MHDVVFMEIANSLQQLSDTGTDLMEHIQRMICSHYVTCYNHLNLLKTAGYNTETGMSEQDKRG